MNQSRTLAFRIEKLDSTENVLETKTVSLVSGSVDVGSGGYRRKCSFSLLESLPQNWQGHRWKLYYGYSNDNLVNFTYYPLGVFIPINPNESEIKSGKIVNYQGVDKVKLYADYQIDSPVTFISGTAVRDIIVQVAGWFNETKLNLEQNLGTLGVDRTFEEGTTAESILNTIVSSFGDEWFYDQNGILVARQVVDPKIRHISLVVDDVESPIYISASTDVDDSNYYNKVTVVGGTVDTPIYRATFQNNDAISLAGGRVVQRYFTIDAAVTQAQVDGRAQFYLSGGVQLPATLSLESLVVPNLEIGDILIKDNIKYEVRSFNIPLSTDIQEIKAGKVV